MPFKCDMTWVAASRRWKKKHKGVTHWVSCRQLGIVEETKTASREAANDWWSKKKAELDAIPPLDPLSRQVVGVLEKVPTATLEALVERGEAASKMLAILNGHSKEDVEAGKLRLSRMAERVLGFLPDEYPTEEDFTQTVADVAAAVRNGPAVDPDRSIQAQAKGWADWHFARVQAGEVSSSRWDAYVRNLGVFTSFLGESAVIDDISAVSMEQYYQCLAQKMAENVYSLDYCKSLFGAAKNFLFRLAEFGLIPLPGNLRRLRFRSDEDDKDRTPIHFTISEVRSLLDASSDKTKLFVLLMLNAGMYQNDISELRDKQVDWKLGTITRKRSKTRRSGYEVTYPLWPETFDLLRRHRATDHSNDFRATAKEVKDLEKYGPRVLLSENGKRLVSYLPVVVDGKKKMKRSDLVNAAFRVAKLKVGQKKSLKVFRKTAAQMLKKNYRHLSQYFLSHAPRTVEERHYTTADEAEFAEAVAWLREELLVKRIKI